mgnify:CR=1 FL=1
MSADIADRLRALARDHLEGRSSLETYRRRRAQLLDGLVGAAAADATQPRGAVVPAGTAQARAARPPEDVTQPRELALSAAAQGPAPAAGSPGRRPAIGPLAGYAGLGLLLAFAGAFIVWRHHPGSAAPARAAAAGTGEASAGGAADPVRALLQPLLEQPDWSDARLLALNEALLEAGRPQIEADRNTDWFDAFVQSVRSRLRQQQALAGAPLTPDSSPLAALAVTLGIDLATPAQPAPAPAPADSERTQSGTQHQALPAHHAAEQRSAVPVPQQSAPAPASASALTSTPAPATSSSTAPPAGAAAADTTAPAAKPASEASPRSKYPACSAALSRQRRNYCQDFLASGEPAPLLAVIARGSFMMGNDGQAEERPVHRVTLAYDFAMYVYEVSQSEFQLYCHRAGKTCPQQPWTQSDDPVVEVSWHDARDYARWLSGATHES